MKQKHFYIFLLLLSFRMLPQTPGGVTPFVVNSAAGSGTTPAGPPGGLIVYYSIGEPVITTAGSGTTFYTQGFLQPDYSGTFGVLTVNGIKTDITCAGSADGSIILNVSGGHGNVAFVWNNIPSDTAVQTGLLAGNYSVIIYDSLPNGTAIAYNNGTPIQFTINDNSSPCPISVPTAFSPNNDGKNDELYITGIENFPVNTVSIFNRWGALVWSVNDYDNTTKAWKGKDRNGVDMAEGTYYYLIEITGEKTRKSWVELTR
jgi:gliding motility-associated-like protein